MAHGFRNYGYSRPSYESIGGGGGGGFRWHITPAIKALVIANAAAFVLTWLLSVFSPGALNSFFAWFGLVPSNLLHGMLWQPFTYLFLHSGPMHLFFNMFGLWMFGMPLERDWGRRRFLRYYFITGVGAGLFSVAVTWASSAMGYGAATFDPMLVPTVGASGAIYGILLAFGMLYPNTPIYVMLLFPIPARLFVILFGAMAFMSALSQGGSSISHAAHLGGMVFGFLYLRGPAGLLFGARKLYANWQLDRARRKFRVYVRETEERESRADRRADRHTGRPDDWVN